MDLKNIFENLGLGEEHGKIYAILLKEGRMRVIEIANKTNIPRTSCYEYFPVMFDLGLIKEVKVGKSRFFEAEDPKILIDLMYKRRNEVEFNLNNLESRFDELREIYHVNYEGEGVRKLEGIEDIFEVITKVDDSSGVKLIYSKKSVDKLSANIKKFINNVIKQYDSVNVDIIDKKETGETLPIKFIFSNSVFIVNFENAIAYEIKDKDVVGQELALFNILS